MTAGSMRAKGAALVLMMAASSGAGEARPLHRFQPDTISVFAGPCRDGGCAVYRIAVRADGTATVQGLAHTSVMGTSSRALGRDAYQQLASALSPYRPGRRTADCAVTHGDSPTYRITWSGERGVSTLEHNLGCDSPLNGILTAVPSQLGIEDLTTMQPPPNALPKPHIFYF